MAALPSGLWLTSPAGWLPRTGISSGTLCSVIEYLPLPFFTWWLTDWLTLVRFHCVCCCTPCCLCVYMFHCLSPNHHVLWLWPATDHVPHCRHAPIKKIWRWTKSIPRNRWWCSHMAGIYSDCSTHKLNNVIVSLYVCLSVDEWGLHVCLSVHLPVCLFVSMCVCV